jgi:hypothetical protein
MNDDPRRTLLLEVAAGRLSSREAAERLAELRDDEPAPAPSPPRAGAGNGSGPRTTATATSTTAETSSTTSAIARVRLEAAAGSVQVIADPGVSGAEVSGPHQMHRQGDVLVIATDMEWGEEGTFVQLGRHGARFGRPRRGGGWTRESFTPPALRLRLRPDLPLEIDLSAGTLSVRDMVGPIRCDVAAGTARIEGFRAPIQCTVNAGKLSAEGVLTEGASRITCDAGAIRLHLDRGSSVRGRVRTTLGKTELRLPDRPADVGGGSLGTTAREFVLGDGAGTLDIVSNLGSVRVQAD